MKTPGLIRSIGCAVAARLRNQLKEAADFRPGLFIEECFVFFLGQSMFEICPDVEVLPPAVQHLETGLAVAAGFLTVGKGDRATQSGAADFQMVFFHG